MMRSREIKTPRAVTSLSNSPDEAIFAITCNAYRMLTPYPDMPLNRLTASRPSGELPSCLSMPNLTVAIVVSARDRRPSFPSSRPPGHPVIRGGSQVIARTDKFGLAPACRRGAHDARRETPHNSHQENVNSSKDKRCSQRF